MASPADPQWNRRGAGRPARPARHGVLVVAAVFIVLPLAWAGVRLAAGSSHGEAAAAGPPRGAAGRGAAPLVTLVAVARHPFSTEISALGVAKARESVTLTAPATELATRILFTSGQHVAKGQVLAELKSDEQQASVTSAESALRKAQSDAERWTELGRQGFAPRAQVEQYQAAFQQATADLAAARSRLRDRVIRAPFSGTIGLSDAARGMLITPGTPIATLDDLSVAYIDFDVPETSLPAIAPHAPVTVIWDGAPGLVMRGEVQQLDTRIKADTRSITVRAVAPNAGGRLKPGMLVKVVVRGAPRESVAAPESAVQFSADQSFVYVVAAAGPTVATRRPVLLGTHDQGLVEVRSGLAAGERVIADGLNRVRPGQPVTVRAAAGAAAAPSVL